MAILIPNRIVYMIKYSVLLLYMMLFFLVGMGVGEFKQRIADRDDLRVHALIEWAGGDKEKLQMVNDFTQYCLAGKYSEGAPKTMAVKTMKECMEERHLEALSSIIRHSDNRLSFPQWPLSIGL